MSYQTAWGSAPGGERIYYQDSQIMVSSTRFQVGPTMYPIRNLAAVSAEEHHRPMVQKGDTSIALLLGIFALLPVCFVGQDPRVMIATPLFGVGALVFAARAKDKHWTESAYTVVVNTNGINQHAYWTPNRGQRDAIVAALHQAIAGG